MKAAEFIELLKDCSVSDFTGVPCSVFKEVISYLEQHEKYIISTNEGEAMGIAAGISLAGGVPAVFMQNDGLGNAINPITSLTKLYELPTLLVISWRGEPGKKDAPQHVWSGKTLLDFLKVMDIETLVLEPDLDSQKQKVKELVEGIKQGNKIGAIICKKGLFEKESISPQDFPERLSRAEAVELIMGQVDRDTPIFSTTGKPSREIYQAHDRDNNFYVVGSMGCTSSIAFGYALNRPDKTIVIDGDGAVLMHMGTLATIGYYEPNKLLHICLDNETYESTGGQRAVSEKIDLSGVARASGYKRVAQVTTGDEINSFLRKWNLKPELSFLHIKVKTVTDPNLPRPKESPVELKNRFMNFK